MGYHSSPLHLDEDPTQFEAATTASGYIPLDRKTLISLAVEKRNAQKMREVAHAQTYVKGAEKNHATEEIEQFTRANPGTYEAAAVQFLWSNLKDLARAAQSKLHTCERVSTPDLKAFIACDFMHPPIAERIVFEDEGDWREHNATRLSRFVYSCLTGFFRKLFAYFKEIGIQKYPLADKYTEVNMRAFFKESFTDPSYIFSAGGLSTLTNFIEMLREAVHAMPVVQAHDEYRKPIDILFEGIGNDIYRDIKQRRITGEKGATENAATCNLQESPEVQDVLCQMIASLSGSVYPSADQAPPGNVVPELRGLERVVASIRKRMFLTGILRKLHKRLDDVGDLPADVTNKDDAFLPFYRAADAQILHGAAVEHIRTYRDAPIFGIRKNTRGRIAKAVSQDAYTIEPAASALYRAMEKVYDLCAAADPGTMHGEIVTEIVTVYMDRLQRIAGKIELALAGKGDVRPFERVGALITDHARLPPIQALINEDGALNEGFANEIREAASRNPLFS